MAATSRTISYDALLSSTLDNYRDQLTDNIFAESVFLSAIKAAGGYETRDGGEQIKVPLMYGKTPVASYSGYDVLDTTPTDGITSAFYTWRQLSTPIAISRIEERKNSSQAQIFDLLKAKIKQAEMSLTQEVNYQLLGKTGSAASDSGTAFSAGNGGKDLDPLALLVSVEASTGTVGTINAANESWWRNRFYDASTGAISTWANLQAKMRKVYNECSRGAGGSPNMILCDSTAFETFEASLADKTRYTQQSKGNLAFDNIMFKAGCAMYWDEMVPDAYTGVDYTSASVATSTMWFLNTKFLQFIVDSQTNFITTPFTKPENQDAKVAHILMYGNLTCSNRRKQGIVGRISQSITA